MSGGGQKHTLDDGLAYLKAIRDTFPDEKEKFKSFQQIMEEYSDERIDAKGVEARVMELFKGHNHLILGLNAFLSCGIETLLPSEDGEPTYANCLNFVHNVKARFGKDSDEYNLLLAKTRMYNDGKKTRDELIHEIANLLEDHEDLLDELTHFFSDILGTDHPTHDVQQQLQSSDKEKEKTITSPDISGASASKDDSGHKRIIYLDKPISQLQLSHKEQCTPSYRLLPEMYILPSQRTELDAEVLNDRWILSSRKETSFKEMHKNECEVALFNCEDQRYELDMLIEYAISAAERVENLLTQINTNRVRGDDPGCIDMRLTASNLRTIEKLYGEHGFEMITALRENPSRGLPIILKRLKQKRNQWKCVRAYLNESLWRNIYAENFHKSLDHRRFYFQEQDKESLSNKALLAEIKKISEKKQEEDSFLRAIVGGNRWPFLPHLEFNYFDPVIHRDMYQIIKYYCGKICTTDAVDKVMNIWTTLLEPMLGVPSRPNGAEDTKDEDNSIERLANANVSVASGSEQITGIADADDASGPTATSSRHGNDSCEGGPDLPSLEGAESVGHLSEREEVELTPDKEIEDKGMADADEVKGDGASLLLSLHTAKPLAKHVPPVLLEKERNSQVFYGNDSFYILFRLHQTLYDRLEFARINSLLAIPGEGLSTARYDRFLTEVYDLLDGVSDIEKFEDECRAIFGIHSYHFLTLDWLIYKLVKQVEAVACNELDTSLLQLYEYEKSRKPRRFIDIFYHANARALLHDENIYRVECSPPPTAKLSIQLLDYGHDETVVTSMEPDFSAYVYSDLLSEIPDKKEKLGIFLKRNARKYACDDEFSSRAMKGLHVINGLELNLACNSSKVTYTFGTEDLLFRTRRTRSKQAMNSQIQSRVERFRKIFSITNSNP